MRLKRYLKKHLKKRNIVILLVLLLILLPLTNSRYIYSGIRNSILESNGFYFYSSVLSERGSSFNIDNWDGVNTYSLNIDVSNIKNEFVYSKNNIYYDISVECSQEVVCTLSKTNGVIFSETKTDSYIITISPTSQIRSGQFISVKTTAKSTSPYVKKLTAEYNIGVTNENFTYKIDDEIGEKFLMLELTNNVSYYEVLTPFSTYNQGDTIPLEIYNELSQSEKNNCFSAIVELTFNPQYINMDLTNTVYKNNIYYNTTTIDGYSYVNNIKFYMGANENKKIIFYKNNVNDNFTYPIITNTSAITVVSTTAH